jgi:hypothetical protein
MVASEVEESHQEADEHRQKKIDSNNSSKY